MTNLTPQAIPALLKGILAPTKVLKDANGICAADSVANGLVVHAQERVVQHPSRSDDGTLGRFFARRIRTAAIFSCKAWLDGSTLSAKRRFDMVYSWPQ